MQLYDYCVVLVTLSALTVTVVVLRRGGLAVLIEALENFRGGPPTGPHPSPADDAFVVLRRRRR